jgi:hypothetical protein
VQLKSSRCRGCRKKLDAVTAILHNDQPEPGNITICMYCGHVQAFDENLKLRDLTDEEIYDIAGDPRILRVQWARWHLMQERKK